MKYQVDGKRLLVITGSGISAESGIPTFRGNEGYWRNHDPMKLATPEGFAQDPALVWEWYAQRRAIIQSKQPNPAHRVVADLAARAAGFLLVTQNVDDLHERAGSSADQTVHIHGDIFVNRCTGCRRHDRTEVSTATLPRCPGCGGLLRPGVVWFGEALGVADVGRVEDFLAGGCCDLVLVVGTTAAFGYILDWAARAAGNNGLLVEVNPEVTALSRLATETIRARAAEALPALFSRQ